MINPNVIHALDAHIQNQEYLHKRHIEQLEAKLADYRSAFAKYIDTVGQCEGVDFTDEVSALSASEKVILDDAVTLSYTINEVTA